jgi:glucan phosphoethanolaminetransferase (alkaline phosphatase superfamily)
MNMETEELKKAWNASDNSLEKLWALNTRCIEMLQTHKAKSKMRSLAIFKTLAALLGIPYVLFLGALVYINHFRNPYFAVSIGMILLITLFSIVEYARELFIIRQINYSENVVNTQEKLSALQSSTLFVTRVIWLQLPFWSTWFWSSKWIDYGSLQFWLIPFPITLFFTLLAIWLYRNISLKNMNKRWFSILMGGFEWTSVRKAMEFLDEIEAFKKG